VMIGAPTYEGPVPPVLDVLNHAAIKRIMNKKRHVRQLRLERSAVRNARQVIEP